MINMVWLYRYYFGSLFLRFYGEFPEKILNLCAQNGITLWNTKASDGGIEANICLRDFYYLRDILRGKGIRLHILEKRGFPFVVFKYRKRPGIIVGLALFLALLKILSGFIWIIDIEGNRGTKEEEIIIACENIGIKTGMRVSNIHTKSQREKLLLQLDTLSWAALNIEGSRLTVNVSEADKSKVDDKKPCNLKAEFDGVIKKIDVTSGNCVVKVGDAVRKGDVLVSGIIENAGSTRFVASKGEIIAEVEKNYKLTEPYEKRIIIPTGKSKTKYVTEIFNIKLPLFLGREQESFEENIKISQLELFGKKLPLKLYRKKFDFVKEYTEKQNEEKMKINLDKRMLEISGENSIKNKEFYSTKNGIELKFTVVSQINIAYRDYLLINAGN